MSKKIVILIKICNFFHPFPLLVANLVSRNKKKYMQSTFFLLTYHHSRQRVKLVIIVITLQAFQAKAIPSPSFSRTICRKWTLYNYKNYRKKWPVLNKKIISWRMSYRRSKSSLKAINLTIVIIQPSLKTRKINDLAGQAIYLAISSHCLTKRRKN